MNFNFAMSIIDCDVAREQSRAGIKKPPYVDYTGGNIASEQSKIFKNFQFRFNRSVVNVVNRSVVDGSVDVVVN